MYYNVSTLMGFTANIENDTYVNELNGDPNLIKAKQKQLLENLKQQFANFFSLNYGVMIIDFVIANHELGYYSSVIVSQTFLNTGYYYDLQIETQNVNIFDSLTFYIRTVIEILFALTTLFNLIHVVYYDCVYAKKLAVKSDHDFFMIEMQAFLPMNVRSERNKTKNKALAKIQNNSKLVAKNIVTEIESEIDSKPIAISKNNENNLKFVPNIKDSVKKARTFDKRKMEKNKHRENLTHNFTWFEFFKSYAALYLNDTLDLVRNIALILSLVLLTKWVTFIIYIIRNSQNIYQGFEFYNVVLNFEFSDSIFEISQQFVSYIRIMSITSIFVFLRLIKLCEAFFPTLTAYVIGLRKSLSDILSFFMLFFLIISGISLILYFYYSEDISDFNTLIFAFINNLYFFIGSANEDLVAKMFSKNSSFTIVYFLVIGLFIKYAFVRILLAIILYNFEGLKFSKGNRYKRVSVSEFKANVKRDFLYGLYFEIKNSPKLLMNFLCCSSHKKRKIKNKENTNNNVVLLKHQRSLTLLNNNEGLSIKVLSLDDLRFVYSKYIENFEMISRNPYFDSPEDIKRVNIYYEKKYETNFKRNIMYLILLIFLILSIFFNVNSPWRFGFQNVIDNMFYKIGYKNLVEINSSKKIDDFLLKQFPAVFKQSKPKEGDDYFMFDQINLIGDKFFITKKRQINKIGSYISDNMRYYEPIDVYKNFNFENKENVTKNSNQLIKTLIYDTENIYAYANYGGLVADFDIDDYYALLKNNQNLNDTVSDSFDNFIIMEFMVENIEIGILAKYTIISIFDYGYFYYNFYNVDILSKSFSSNKFQIFRFAFIFILFILIIYETYELIKEVKQLNDSYNSWFIKRRISTSMQAKVARKHINPELIRKIKLILNPIRALMLFILVSLYAYIVLFLVSISLEAEFYTIYDIYRENLLQLKSSKQDPILLSLDKKYLYELKNQFTRISNFRNSYDKLSAFLLFFSSLKIMFSLNLGKYFNSISQIAVKTLTKNLMIVILLFLMLPSFVFYSYLMFGVIDKNYRSFIDSILSNFLRLFDFRNDLPQEANKGMKALYVILFSFIMNLIVLNLFVSIINNSYQKVKSKIFYSSENFSWIKIIFFCCNKKKIISNNIGKEIIQNEIENFIKTQEAEPMVNLNMDFKSYSDFANYEIDKLKQVNECLSWIQSRTDLMQFSLICKNNRNDSNNLSDDRFKNVDQDLMNLQYFASLNYQMQLVNSLEKDVLDIKESNYKHSVYLLSRKDLKDNVDDEIDKNEKMIKELVLLEKQYMDLISDIEELRKIKNEIDETNRTIM